MGTLLALPSLLLALISGKIVSTWGKSSPEITQDLVECARSHTIWGESSPPPVSAILLEISIGGGGASLSVAEVAGYMEVAEQAGAAGAAGQGGNP